MADDKSENATDRRSLIAAVAAAGAAVTLGATAARAQDDVKRCGNEPRPRFVVDLGDVQLPASVAAVLNEQIRKAALTAVARAGVKVNIYDGKLPPYWYGIYVIPHINQIHDLPNRQQQ